MGPQHVNQSIAVDISQPATIICAGTRDEVAIGEFPLGVLEPTVAGVQPSYSWLTAMGPHDINQSISVDISQLATFGCELETR